MTSPRQRAPRATVKVGEDVVEAVARAVNPNAFDMVARVQSAQALREWTEECDETRTQVRQTIAAYEAARFALRPAPPLEGVREIMHELILIARTLEETNDDRLANKADEARHMLERLSRQAAEARNAALEGTPTVSFQDVLSKMETAMKAHPFWKRCEGTPLANDLPVIAANIACSTNSKSPSMEPKA